MSEKLELLWNATKSGDCKQVSCLIYDGVDLNAELENGSKAIHLAAASGHDKVIEVLLIGGVAADSTDSAFNTALHVAVERYRVSTIELLSKYANSNIQGYQKKTALHMALKGFAACSNHNDCVTDVYNKSESINFYLNNAPLKAKCGYLAIAAFLIKEANADVTIEDEDGKTPLDYIKTRRNLIQAYLQMYSKHKPFKLVHNIEECIQCIEDSLGRNQEFITRIGYDLESDITNWRKRSYCDAELAVLLSMKDNDTVLFNLLLKNFLRVNAVFSEKKRAIHFAVMNAADKCLEILLRNKCEVNIQEKNGMTPIMYAVMNPERDDVDLRRRQNNVIKLLMESKRLDLKLVDKNGSTCAHVAAKHSNLFALEFFKNIDPSIFSMKDMTGNEVSHYAATNNSRDIMDFLLKAGTDLNAKGENNLTPFHVAIKHSSFDVIELLINSVANFAAADRDNCTPVSYAIRGYYGCCLKSEGHECTYSDALRSCPTLYAYFISLAQLKSPKCAFLAVAAVVDSGFVSRLPLRTFAQSTANSESLEECCQRIARNEVESLRSDIGALRQSNVNSIQELERESESNRIKIVQLENVLREKNNKIMEMERNLDECLKFNGDRQKRFLIEIQEKEKVIESNREKLEKHDNALRENNHIILGMKFQLDEYKNAITEKDKVFFSMQSSLTTMINLCEENRKASLKERENEIASIKKELAECSALSQNLNATLNDKRNEGKDKDLEIMRIKLEKCNDALREKENEVVELRKQLVESTKLCEEKEKLIGEKISATIVEKEREIRIALEKLTTKQDEIHEFKKRIEYLESFYLCSKCGEARISLILLCGHKYCDDCYGRFGDSCPVDN